MLQVGRTSQRPNHNWTYHIWVSNYDTMINNIIIPSSPIFCGALYSPDIDDLFTLNSELLDVAHNWKSLGLALRLKPSLLSRIQKDCSDVKNSLVELLTEWLNKAYNTTRFGDPTWQLLVAAVAHPAGGNNPALAQHIARRYNGEYVMATCVYIQFHCVHLHV